MTLGVIRTYHTNLGQNALSMKANIRCAFSEDILSCHRCQFFVYLNFDVSFGQCFHKRFGWRVQLRS